MLSHLIEGYQSMITAARSKPQLKLCVCWQGKFIHVAPLEPRSDWNCGFEKPWWQDPDEYCIGRLTAGTVLIRIMNMLTGTEDFLEVCLTLQAVQEASLSCLY